MYIKTIYLRNRGGCVVNCSSLIVVNTEQVDITDTWNNFVCFDINTWLALENQVRINNELPFNLSDKLKLTQNEKIQLVYYMKQGVFN
jgi:hypothetical protein